MSLLLGSGSAGSNPISALGIVLQRRIALWIARVWISAVIVGSLLPGSAKIGLHASEDRRAMHTHARTAVAIRHRLVHLFAFGSSFLVLSALATRKREQLEAAAEILAIGCIVELTQYFVYSHRLVFEWWDVRDDAIGIALAFLLVQTMNRKKLLIGSRS